MADGQVYEDAAARMLEAAGLAVIERNFRCKPGELDLVCRDGGALVFVEVRKRSHPRFGSAAASVGRAKQLKLIRAAQIYLRSRRLEGRCRCRFDLVTFDPDDSGAAGDMRMQWLKNAFTR